MGAWDVGPGVVEFPDGRRFRGRGLRGGPPVGQPPEYAVYLLGRDPQIQDWTYCWVRWPDFRLPRSTDDALEALREAHDRAPRERVEVGCGGGIGRTGTALSVLGLLSGIPVDEIVG